MARFLGAVQGGRGEATRLGAKNSGIRAQAQGWGEGVKTYGYVNDEGEDVFAIYATSGSRGAAGGQFLGHVKLDDQGKPSFYLNKASDVVLEGETEWAS